MLEEITVKLDGKPYFDLLRKAQLYDELGQPDTVEELIGRIQVLEDRLTMNKAVDQEYANKWVTSNTMNVNRPLPLSGERADTLDD